MFPLNRSSAEELFGEEPQLFRQTTAAWDVEEDAAMKKGCEGSGFDSDEDEYFVPESYKEQEIDLNFG